MELSSPRRRYFDAGDERSLTRPKSQIGSVPIIGEYARDGTPFTLRPERVVLEQSVNAKQVRFGSVAGIV